MDNQKLLNKIYTLQVLAESYSDTAKGTIITRERALHELAKHGVDTHESIEEFYADMGKKTHYDATKVLHWLGY